MNTQLDAPPVSLFNESGCARLLLVCEHASNYIPARFQNLQLSDDALQSHIARDIGAIELAQAISRLLNAPLLSTTVSRLVYDCNRQFGMADAIPLKSEVLEIPGNQNLSEAEAKDRFEKYYLPFEISISDHLAKFAEPPLLLAIHSFTPIYYGKKRTVDIGIINDQDSRLTDQMVQLLQQQTKLCVAPNYPYSAKDNVTHTLSLHGDNNDLLNAMVEVKNDLLGTVEKCQEMALMLATLISNSANHFGVNIPLSNDYATNN